MVLFQFGHYDYICRTIPSLPSCNLFFRQLLVHPNGVTAPATNLLGLPDAGTAEFSEALSRYGVGVDISCYIRRMAVVGGEPGSVGNVANIALCGLSVLLALVLAFLAGRRAAAVGRVEMRILFVMYALVQGAQLVDTGAILRAGSTALTWVSAVHLGLVVGLFWCLIWVAFLSLQFVEDGTLGSVVPMVAIGTILTVGSGYIFADIGFTVTSFFRSDNPAELRSIWLFVLTIIWPAAAAAVYFILQMLVVVRVLREKKPLILFSASAFAFILSQGAYYALSHRICTGTSHRVDGSFLATLLETVAITLLFVAWRSITEDSWDGTAYID